MGVPGSGAGDMAAAARGPDDPPTSAERGRHAGAGAAAGAADAAGSGSAAGAGAGTAAAADAGAPLRHDVGTLGALLGEVLREQGGAALFDAVEQARHLAQRRRQGDAGAEATLLAQLAALTPAATLELVRAFSAYFGLVNLAERVHRIRRRRAYLAAQSPPQPGSLVAVLTALRAQGVPAAAVLRALAGLEIMPVFTAHPTEATRRSLLRKEQRMARALVAELAGPRLPGEAAAATARLRQEITAAWQTDELTEQPSVADEVEHVVFYLAEVIYRIVPVFYEGLDAALRRVYGVALPEDAARPQVCFGSWVGGDMDGNPNVGPATIRATLTRHRARVLERYIGELRGLADALSQSTTRVAVDPAVHARIAALQASLPGPALPARLREMPYRALLTLMGRALEATLAAAPHGYVGPEALHADLALIAASLQAHGGAHAGAFAVRRALLRVRTFGFHLATLDVRQDAWVHRRAVGAWLGRSDFAALPAAARLAALQDALARPPPGMRPDDLDAARVDGVMREIGACRAAFGARAIGPYIISMCQGLDDVLAVLFLARCAGLTDTDGAVALDVAPLFETVPDLRAAAPCLTAMLADAGYRAHLRRRGMQQLVMLGYSDSSKESGILASRWALQEAQVAMTAAADAAGVQLALFHGRGGSASRGGSRPRDAILAEPPGTVRGRLRLTEQGEIIDARYGLRDIALRTIELMGGAVLEATLRDAQVSGANAGSGAVSGAAAPADYRAALATMAAASRTAFRALVYDDPEFFAYFSAATPIDVIGRLRIGSRPAARRSQRGIEDLRAIPWVFAWTQNRQLLPGWYGVGAGLAAAEAAHGLPLLREMRQRWPFFANLLADAAMVMGRADMAIGARYAALAGPVGARIGGRIRADFAATVELLGAAREATTLLAHEPVLARGIALRNPYVDPMSLAQIDLLARWRAGNREDVALERLLLTTVKGIARGLHGTG